MPIFDRLKHGVHVTKFKADQLLRINRVQGELGGLEVLTMAEIERRVMMWKQTLTIIVSSG